jgi:outer membrane protein
MFRPATLVVAFLVLALCPTAAPAADSAARLVGLPEAYRLAMAKNPTLEAMEARIAAAEAERRRAWAQLKPTARVSGTFTHSRPEIIVDASAFSPPGTPPGDPIVIQQQNQFGWQFEAGLPLFRGPAYQQLGVAKKGIVSARLRLERARQDYAVRVAQAYYAALGAREVVAALDDKVAVDRKNLEVARARLEVGRVTRSEVLRAELELVRDKQRRLQQQNALVAARRRVAILIGVDQTIRLERPQQPAMPALREPEGAAAKAAEHRVDLKALERDVAAARQGKKAVWWSFLPLLDLNVLYQWQEAAGFAGQRDSLAVVATLSLPLYEGGLRYAELDRARAREREAEAARRELLRQIAVRMADLTAELESAEAGIVSAKKGVALAEVTVQEMTARYEVGSATQLDLLDATQRQLQARIELTQSTYARDVARIALTHELGRFRP